jgi:hypothetical protein
MHVYFCAQTCVHHQLPVAQMLIVSWQTTRNSVHVQSHWLVMQKQGAVSQRQCASQNMTAPVKKPAMLACVRRPADRK